MSARPSCLTSVCLLYPPAPRGDFPINSTFLLCGHKKTANRCGHTASAEERGLGSLRSPSEGLMWPQWLSLSYNHSLIPSLQPEVFDMLIGLPVTILSCRYQGPNVELRLVCWGSLRLPQFGWFAGRARRTQHIVLLRAVICYSETMPIKIRGKARME